MRENSKREFTNEQLRVATRADLKRRGFTHTKIARALESGRLVRLGRGMYAFAARLPETVVMRAANHGCWVACFSALRLYGVWTPPGRDYPHHFTSTWNRVKNRPLLKRRLAGHKVRTVAPGRALVVPLVDALAEAARCGTPEEALIVLESALNLQLVTRDEVERILCELPRKRAKAIGHVSEFSQSGTETALKRRLERKGYAVRQQVWFENVGWVDMMVGNSLVIEVDSFLHHEADRTTYRRDRERDARLIALGYTVIRLTYQQVFENWAETEVLIQQALRRRAHWRKVA